MTVKDFLKGYKTNSFFILDSHQEAMSKQEEGHRYEDSDYYEYSYNIHHFNQLTEGSLFLYRRPAKLSKNGKFLIYGGGVIASISEPDIAGNVRAKIKYGYNLIPPLEQGEVFLENFTWKTRQKPGPGWKGFWLNYGMNKIAENDFWRLIEKCTISINETIDLNCNTIEEDSSVDPLISKDVFAVEEKDGFLSKESHKSKIIGDIDFLSLNRKKKNLGTAGELVVLAYENDRLTKLGINRKAEYVADTISDGLGYDIRSYDEYGNEIHIEVKTTRSNYCDGFYLSAHELEESKNKMFPYWIYRLYNFNEKTHHAFLRVYKEEITNKHFSLVPQTYKVFYKSQSTDIETE